jgi:uncharacterized membrane protein
MPPQQTTEPQQPSQENQPQTPADATLPSNGQPAPNQMMIPFAGVQIHQGPIPRAEDLAAYERVVKGSADRIIKMAEREQKASIHLRWGDWFSQFMSMLLGKGFLYFLLGVTAYLAIRGKSVAAILTGVAPVASVVYSTLFGEKNKD